jgi:glycosyltransferase involved in cell wall biosynthesis
MPLISVIVPVYKVEAYIRRCVNSILKQTFTDFECILVDDGSPDNCPKICDEYAEKDVRFKIIHKKQNEGLPKARKSGLDIAKSKFVFHLDSDDWLESNALELLYKKQQETDADIVTGGFREISAFSIENILYPTFDKNDTPLVYLFRSRLGYLWGRLYRKELFNSYVVPTTNILEDIAVNAQIFIRLSYSKFQILNAILYNYDRRTTGMIISMHKYNNYDALCEYPQMRTLLWVKDYFEDNNLNEYELSMFKYFVLLTAVFPYFRFNKLIKKEDVSLALQFYKKCNFLNLLSIHNRVIMLSFRISTILGKRCVLLFNWISRIKMLLML